MIRGSITDDTICLASGCSIFDLYESREHALADKRRADETMRQWNPESSGYVVMTYGEMKARRRELLLSNPLVEVSREHFDKALECLPPLRWHIKDCVERFLMSEFYTASFTSQYVRLGDRQFSRMVDAADESTWITREEIEAFVAGEAAVGMAG